MPARQRPQGILPPGALACISHFVVNTVANAGGWAGLKDLHRSSSAAKTLNLDIMQRRFGVEIVNVFLYIRAMSRILVDLCVSSAKEPPLTDVWALAFGSTDITSDYDVSFVGPGAIRAARCVALSFEEAFRGEHLASIADTNIYVGPGFAFASGGAMNSRTCWPPDWFLEQLLVDESTVLAASGISPAWKLAYPIPLSKVGLLSELQALHAKQGRYLPAVAFSSHTQYSERYRFDVMLEAGGRLANFYYGTGDLDEETYWNTAASLMAHAAEAYACISTVLVVVVEMQAGQREAVNVRLSSLHYMIAAAENLMDLKHHSGSAGNVREIKEEKAVQASKYALRTLHCLAQAGGKAARLNAAFQDLLAHVGVVKEVVALRGQKVKVDNLDVKKYMTQVLPALWASEAFMWRILDDALYAVENLP